MKQANYAVQGRQWAVHYVHCLYVYVTSQTTNQQNHTTAEKMQA